MAAVICRIFMVEKQLHFSITHDLQSAVTKYHMRLSHVLSTGQQWHCLQK